jgi:hypothetical protein
MLLPHSAQFNSTAKASDSDNIDDDPTKIICDVDDDIIAAARNSQDVDSSLHGLSLEILSKVLPQNSDLPLDQVTG